MANLLVCVTLVVTVVVVAVTGSGAGFALLDDALQ